MKFQATRLLSFLGALRNPQSIWEKAFLKHITPVCRHLLIAMYFLSEYGSDLDELRLAFENCHAKLSAKYGTSRDPKDFEEALKVLEGGFVVIHNGAVDYVNPSLRDYLKTYLTDIEILTDLAGTLVTAKSARSLWTFADDVCAATLSQKQRIAFGLKEATRLFPTSPVWKTDKIDTTRSVLHDLGMTLRV